MSLELEIQNPYELDHIPSQEVLLKWASSAVVTKATQPSVLGKDGADYSVVIRVVDESESRELNHTYRNKNAPTNVLSFPFEMPELSGFESSEESIEVLHLGDLVFCQPIIEREALQQHKTLTHHWAHLLIHGMLHLQGYDHIEDDEALVMESLEINLLQQFGINNPYESNDLTIDEAKDT